MRCPGARKAGDQLHHGIDIASVGFLGGPRDTGSQDIQAVYVVNVLH